jgi:hypothetical protein
MRPPIKISGRELRSDNGVARKLLRGWKSVYGPVRALGWKPEFASLESIIRTAWEWHRKRP